MTETAQELVTLVMLGFLRQPNLRSIASGDSMLQIDCPWCGPRAEIEFSYGGEAHIQRPADPDALSDAEWADYLFYETNTMGSFPEQWCHTHGCRRWFNVRRNTVTYKIEAVYRMGEQAPEAKA